ncbi:MAG: biotin/lipoyl-binding protein [Candidatus Tumulicola sp.]
MTRSRGFGAAIVVAALAIAGIAGWMFANRGQPSPTASTKPHVPTQAARDGFVERTIALAGRVGPAAGTQSKLAFSVPGTVARVDVRLGERVETGTPLAQIDATTYSLAAQQAGADAQAAAAGAAVAAVDRVSVKLRVDRAELRRQQRLYAAGIVALRDVAAGQAAVAADLADSKSAGGQLVAARAQSRSASVHAASAQYDLSRTILRAPASGIVTAVFVAPGDAVDPTVSAIALTPALAHVATLDAPVNDVLRIAAGNLVHAQASGRHFDARVAGVAPAVNPATGLALIDVRGIPDDLPAGTPIDATVVVGRVRGLIVPRSAIVEDPQNGNTLVFVQTHAPDGSARFSSRVVTIDAQSSTFVRVTAGLRAGERVAAQGAIDLLAPSGG